MLDLELRILDQVMESRPPWKIIRYFESCYQDNPRYLFYKRELVLSSIKWNHLELFKALLHRNYPVQVDRNENLNIPSALHFACFVNRKDVVETLLGRNCKHDVDKKEKFDWNSNEKKSVTDLVLENDNAELLELVLPFSKQSSSILPNACKVGGCECLHYLLRETRHRNWVNSPVTRDGQCPFLLASLRGAGVFAVVLQHCGSGLSSINTADVHQILSNLCSQICEELPHVLETLVRSGHVPPCTNPSDRNKHNSPIKALLEKVTWPLEKDENGNGNLSQMADMGLTRFHQIIQQSLQILLTNEIISVDPRKAPDLNENLVGYIQSKLYDIWGSLGQEQFAQQVQLTHVQQGIVNRLDTQVKCFTQLLVSLDTLVKHGALINYEHYISPNVVENMRNTFRSHRAYSQEEEIEVHILYPNIKEFFYLLLLVTGHSSLLLQKLEPAFKLLTEILLLHGLSDKEKSHILDLVRMPGVWTTTLKAIPNKAYYQHIQYAIHRMRDRCHVFAYKDRDFQNSLKTLVKTPRSLMDMCRVSIRNSLGPCMTHKMADVELPTLLKSYVLNLEE